MWNETVYSLRGGVIEHMETLTKRSELLKIEKSQEKIEDNNPT